MYRNIKTQSGTSKTNIILEVKYTSLKERTVDYVVTDFKLGVLVTQSCPAFCNPMDCSLASSSVHGILQARILEWVASLFTRGSS